MFLVLLAASNNFSGSASGAFSSLTSTSTIAAVIISALVSSGIVGALMKLRPERNLIITQAAEKAVDTVSGLLDHMRRDLTEALAEVDRLKERERELLTRIHHLEQRARDAEEALRRELKECQAQLEFARKVYLDLLGEHANCPR